MHFIWSAKPPSLTSCHSGISYDITPLAPTSVSTPAPPPSLPPLPSAITMSDRHLTHRYCISPGVICPSCSIRLSLPNIFPLERFFLGFIFHNGRNRGPVVRNLRSEGSKVHNHSVRPRQPWDQRCFGGPNGILMFISTVDVRGGGGESQQRAVRGRLAESWQTENVFPHVTADYIHSGVRKEQGGDGDVGLGWTKETLICFRR